MVENLSRGEFREAYEAHRDAVHRFAWRLTGRAEDAEDLTQETFVTYWRKQEQYRGEGPLLSFLRRIAYRAFLNSRARFASRHPPVPLEASPEPAAPPSSPAEERDLEAYRRARISEAVGALPDVVRESFVMHRFEGMTVAEVAEVTGAPVKTVESRLAKAVSTLAVRLRRFRDQLLPR